MGYAHGQLLKDDLQVFYPQLWKYLIDKAEREAKDWKLPEWVKRLIVEEGLDIALDLTYEATVRYTGKYIYEEMQGVADGAAVDFKTLRRIHLVRLFYNVLFKLAGFLRLVQLTQSCFFFYSKRLVNLQRVAAVC